jgi:hypothetical protein
MKKVKKPKKDLGYVWSFIDTTVIILVLYSLLDLTLSVSTYIQKLFPATIFSIFLTIFAFGMIGYEGKKSKEESNYIAKLGAYAGLIVGLVSAIIGFITFYFYPEKLALALEAARDAGADMALVQSMMKIGLYINLGLLPVINAGIGALIAWISSFIFKFK